MEQIKTTKNKLIAGKAKNVYLNDKNTILIEYTNNITAFNNKRKDTLEHKGEINCEITMLLFDLLQKANIKTHLVKQVNKTDIICKKLKMFPLEVIVRNYAKGSVVKRFELKEYLQFKEPIVEFSLKEDHLNDPLISERQIIGFGIATKEQLDEIIKQVLKINDVLSKHFIKSNITLLDFKVEFGMDQDGTILLADEISPDCMRLENLKTKVKYDKDVYRLELGDVLAGYKAFLKVLKNDK